MESDGPAHLFPLQRLLVSFQWLWLGLSIPVALLAVAKVLQYKP